MPRFGIDYAWGQPSIASLKKAGVTFVCRYVSTPGNTKNLRPDEAARLKKAGIDIVVVFETVQGRALAGHAAGVADAKSAEAQVIGAGGPPGSIIYFAVDFDASDAERLKVNEYLRGAGAILGLHRVGVYGGLRVVRDALDARVAVYAWQTYAWSGGVWDLRACLHQYSNGHRIDGVSVDYDQATAPDFGQWYPPRTDPIVYKPPVLGALPGPAKKPPWFWAALREFLARRKKNTPL